MENFALFDFTPNFCPDCGTQIVESFNHKYFLELRQGKKQICHNCRLTFFYVKDLETISWRIQDEKES